ncbi:hypothetical protein [Pseudonocardia charpentierae]|uniref:Uncharacterized protein n=1 Tax=Pseudonocardia charpentierae TaxID=3075545 RepID=A0ABU2NER5_9PSEU|nr:hypothetical protein [Pseudonocardia sp. DSM 45834]MDT0351114.1 hypothetical protein [Pseudonocardia sp. DSM 45834]
MERYDGLIRLYVLPTFAQSRPQSSMSSCWNARLHCRDMCTGRPRAGHTCRPLTTSTMHKVH